MDGPCNRVTFSGILQDLFCVRCSGFFRGPFSRSVGPVGDFLDPNVFLVAIFGDEKKG